jgi:glutamine amidotransferase
VSKKILVVNYKTGNVDSVIKAIKVAGYEVIFSSEKKDFDNVSKIVLPGQGAYDYAMDQLNKLDLKQKIIECAQKGMPILGICLGMQILSDNGSENCNSKGLGLIEGNVEILKDKPNKLPHLGWNSVKFVDKKNKLFSNITDEKDFYFIHGYYFNCKNKSDILATSDFNIEFPSIINSGLIYGIQFHPEKSHKNGLKLIENFLKIDE